MRVAAALLAALLLAPAVARADVDELLGKPVGAITLSVDGHQVSDPKVLALIETHLGDPLAASAVRESIAHIFSLGRFEDVRVNAELTGGVVSLRYELVPLRVVSGVSFEGSGAPGIDRGRLHGAVVERYGESPRADRTADIARFLEEQLHRSGYLRATVHASVKDAGRDRSTLAFELIPGDRSVLSDVRIEGDSGIALPAFRDRLGLAAGRPYQPDALESRIERYLEDRRARGYYAARVSLLPRPSEDGRAVDLLVTVTQGPHVRLVFRGDPLPSERRDELVPIAREGSTDEDLLEDATNRIEDQLHAQGYRDAAAPHAREEHDGELTITFTITRGPQYRVGPISVEGNNAIAASTILAGLRVKTGQPYSAAAIEADMTVLEDTYHRQGFAAAEAEVMTDDTTPFEGGIEVPLGVTITVREGVRTVVDSVTFEGNRMFTDDQLREVIGLNPGGPLFATQMVLDRDAIELLYANRGFSSAVVAGNPRITPDGSTARVVYTVSEGGQIFVDHILIVGNERTRTAMIEHELQFKAGDALGLAAVNESQRRLVALGLFRRARISMLQQGDASKRDVLVTVEEAPLTTSAETVGLEGYRRNTRDSPDASSGKFELAPRASFEVGRRNLFGRNQSVNLYVGGSLVPERSEVTDAAVAASGGALQFPQYRLLGQFREPGFLNTGADLRITGALEQQRRSSFDFARRSASAELAKRLTKTVSVSGGYQIQRSRVFNQQVDESEQRDIDRILPKVRLSLFSGSVIRDTRDDAVEPTMGRYVSANAQLAARAIGSQVGFAKSFFTAQSFRVIQLRRPMVFAASARLGMATTFAGPNVIEGSSDLPASERFFAGGDTTVRGFALDQLGVRHTPPQPEDTLDSANLPLGGSGLVILNGEMRVPIKGDFGVVGFLDTGNVFKATSDIDLTALRTAVGFGVRYRSPLGTIRVDLGFKLARQDFGASGREPLTALHISFGQAF